MATSWVACSMEDLQGKNIVVVYVRQLGGEGKLVGILLSE